MDGGSVRGHAGSSCDCGGWNRKRKGEEGQTDQKFRRGSVRGESEASSRVGGEPENLKERPHD